MYGSTIGSLHLDVWNGSSWDLDVWSRSGDNGNSWVQQTVDLSAQGYTAGTIKLRFRGISGGTFYGDISLDTIRVFGNLACSATAPGDLAATAPHGGQVDLTWTYDGSNNNYYKIYRDGILIGNSSTGSYTDDTVAVSTNYDYTVRGYNEGEACESGDSNTANVTTGSCAPSTGPLVIEGGTLSGRTVDLLSVVATNGVPAADISNVNVTGYLAPDFDELESFSGAGSQGWSAEWTTNNSASPPENGDLMTGVTTRSENTGPGAAPNGAFLYYEASNGAGTDRYLTHTATFSADDNELGISFLYNMNGADIGTLELQVSHNGGGWVTEWTQSGNQGDSWIPVTLDFETLDAAYASGDLQIRFRFTYGGGPQGDIALDEVRVSGPGRSDNITYFNDNGTAAQTAVADGSGADPAWPDGETLRLEVIGVDDCSTPLDVIGSFTFIADFVAPTVTGFSMPTDTVSPVSVYSFTASDNLAVTGYLVTEDPAAPLPGDAGWSATPPTRVTTGSTGAVTFYAWAKDDGGNVSSSLSQAVNVSADVTAPEVTSFSMPASSYSPIPVTSLSAHDDSGVIAGYMVTTSATPPAPGDGGWTTFPPATVTHGVQETVTFYAWAKDSAGNVSAAATADVDVQVDSTAPTVDEFVMPATSSATTIAVTSFSAVDNVGVTGYMITESTTPPAADDSGWKGFPPTSVTTTTTADPEDVTFYAWAKDSSDNVSSYASQTVTIDLPATCDYEIDPANGTYIEAENLTNMTAPNPWAWSVIDTPLADSDGDLSSGGYLQTTTGGTGTQPNGSRTDYPVVFPAGEGGTYCIWIRALDASGSGGGDSTFWGVDGVVVGAITEASDNQWAWDGDIQNGNNCTYIGEGPHTLNLWPREAGQKTDGFFIIKNIDPDSDPSAGGVFTGDNDEITTVSDLDSGGVVKMTVDPSCVDASGGGAPGSGGGGGGYIDIPDGQSAKGSVLNPENLYTTDLAATERQYRALGAESDGFGDFSVASKWIKTDIGGDSTPPASISNESLVLVGSGANIWGTRDSFSYLYQSGVSGDFTIDVKVESMTGTANFAKAGIMVRQSLASNSAHATSLLTWNQGAGFYRRRTSGGSSYNTLASGITAPRWVRIKRSGNTFTGYYSSDGISWTQVGSDTIVMSDPVNIGLAVTSANSSADNTSVFDNFLFMPASTSGMSETWQATSGASPASIDASGWSDGDYALSVRSTGGGVEPETSTFSYSSCNDATPSAITVKSGHEVSGPSVSLPGLFEHTGNVGTFTYRINGVDVQNPWNSYSEVASGTSDTVTFEVTGYDPDCGGSTISDSGVILVDNTCNDTNPSTITVLTGQTAGGSHVDLTELFTYTGDVNVNGFTFRINGEVIGDPTAWDSRAYGTVAAEGVNFEVSGVDPPCGNEITATNTLEIDNVCLRNPPSISFDKDLGYVGAGRATPYEVTIRNEDSYNCSPSTLTVAIDSDSNGTDFEASYFPAPSTITDAGFTVAGDNLSATIELGGRESATIELAVSAQDGATEWESNDATLSVTNASGSDNESLTTVVFLVSPITHNSVTTGSGKWGGSWGTSKTGSQYGNFDCLTCHEKGGPNIKWMKGEIHLPGATWGTGGTVEDLPITFQDARDGSTDWGNDDYDAGDGYDPAPAGVGRTGSTRPCEVCHTRTMYHRYDTEADPDGGGPLTPQTVYNHFPDRDCIDCHRHSLGFTASCTGCHGDPPLDASLGGPNGLADIPAATGSTTPGTHYKHVVVLEYPCEYCHAGWRDVGEMPKEVGGQQDINHSFNIFDKVSGLTLPYDAFEQKTYDTATAGNYTGQDGVSYEGVVTAQGQGTMTCENIYCHGGTENMGGTNPRWDGNIACTSCHGTSATNTPPGFSHTTHVGEMGQPCWYCHGGDGDPTNDEQEGIPEPGSNGHVNGSVGWDLSGLAAAFGTPYGTPTYKGSQTGETGDFAPSSEFGSYGTCANVICHFGVETPAWNNNDQPATCITCHTDGSLTDQHDLSGEADYQALSTDAERSEWILRRAAPNTGNHEDHVHPAMAHQGDADVASHENMVAGYVNKCESCHGGGSNTGDHAGHLDFTTTIGGGMSYNSSQNTCTSQCHGPEGLNIWGYVGSLPCQACHAAPYLGPTVVDPDNEGIGLVDGIASNYGSHLKVLKTDSLDANTDWDAQCQMCHPYHGDEGNASYAEVPLPPADWDNPGTSGTTEQYNMRERLGLQYTTTGGIHLGGSATTGNSEAEICWGCHDNAANNISEWGTNTSANTGSITYDYGSLDTSNWTSATWTSGYAGFSYKSAPVQSTHAVGMANGHEGVNGVDAVANIRCSYCHDVHDMNQAVLAGTTTNESMTGKPYLRGSWFGNPYKEDGAPQSGTSYTNFSTDQYGSVPRGSKDPTQKMGGYWIDQNSGDPVSAWTPSEFGGLCEMCHGNGDGTLSSSEIDSLNYFGSQGAGWVSGYNGHANSVKGGSGGGGLSARNIFNDTDRGGGSTNDYNGSMAYWGFQEPGDQNAGIRANDGDALNEQPYVDRYSDEPCANDNNNCNGSYRVDWDDLRGMTVRGSSTGNPDNNYHTFSCSKCHNPHASRLPKLMITNCLDTKQNQWDNNYQISNWSAPAVLDGATASNWTTAQNCHRLAGNDPMDGDDDPGMGSGWNLVTPWTDGDANYGTTGDKAQDNTGTW